MSTPAKVQEWLRNNNGTLPDAYKAVEYEGPPLKIKEGNLSNLRHKIRLSFRGENGDHARKKFDTTSTPKAHYESKQLQKKSSALSREASMYDLEGTRIEHLADQDDAKSITAGAAGDPDNKAIVKASDAEFKNEVKRRVGKNYAVTLNPAEDAIKAVPKKYFDPIADPNTLPGTNLRNLKELADFIRNGSTATKFAAKMSPWLEYIPEIDQATGGHINNTLNSGFDYLRSLAVQRLKQLANSYASSKPLQGGSNVDYGQ